MLSTSLFHLYKRSENDFFSMAPMREITSMLSPFTNIKSMRRPRNNKIKDQMNTISFFSMS